MEKMENDAEETLSPMLLEDSPPADETKKRAWLCRLQIPLGILIVGLVGGGVLSFLSLADSKDVERVKAGNISLGDFQERNRRHVLSSGGCTIEQAKDYLGWDLEGGSKIKVTANQQECADYSASTPGSRFWTWSKTTKMCYPKSSKAGRRGAGIELVSGNNRCANSGIWQQLNGDADCWKQCGRKGGLCEGFCGPKGYCCRKGHHDCPVLAANVSPRHHTCVTQGTWAPLGEADCWNPCGGKGGLCQHFCGHKGYCCRKGFDDCPVLASEWASPLRHTCVNFGKFDCTDTFKNRLASFEYNYYPGYWIANWPGIGWASSSEAKSNKEFQWILHDCGDSVCMESKKPYWKDNRFLGVYVDGKGIYIPPHVEAMMWRVVTDPSDGSNEQIQHRIFCDSCNPGGLEKTTFSNCQIINKVGQYYPNKNNRLYSNRKGHLEYCSHCGYDSWFSWRIESPTTRVYWKVVLDHCNRGTTNDTLTYTVKTSITTSTSTTTEVTVDTKISLGLEAGKLLEAVGRTVGGELGASFKWSRTQVEQLAHSKTTKISTQLEPGMKWVVSQAMGEAGWTSIATDSSKAEKIPC